MESPALEDVAEQVSVCQPRTCTHAGRHPPLSFEHGASRVTQELQEVAQHLKHLRRDNEQLRTNFDDVRSLRSLASDSPVDQWGFFSSRGSLLEQSTCTSRQSVHTRVGHRRIW